MLNPVVRKKPKDFNRLTITSQQTFVSGFNFAPDTPFHPLNVTICGTKLQVTDCNLEGIFCAFVHLQLISDQDYSNILRDGGRGIERRNL